MTEETPSGEAPQDPRRKPVGTEVAEVEVEIDYAILQHFSKFLYASPNKAVEELVTNGYDALATRVDVFLPGTWAEDCLIVWDDGTSMDVQGLKHLWWIARSPKTELGEERVAVSPDGTRRQMVGKFGIGKLASYAVGDRLSHLCRRGDEYLLVSVDYQRAPQLSDDPGRPRSFQTPVLRLDEETAQTYASSLMRTTPEDWAALLARPHWTIAIVEALKPDVALTEGRLSWVMGNGMPLRPDFEVRVNGAPVRPSALKTALVDWNMGTPEVQEGLTDNWTSAANRSDVQGTPTYGTGREAGEEIHGGGDPGADAGLAAAQTAWVDLPGLGKVSARLRLFETSLREGRAGSHGRSEGFFVYVKGRLLNPDDAKLLLPDPSFGTFNRMQVTIWADGLDAELLADRERLQRSTEAAEALAVLQQSLYRTGRQHLERHDDEERQANAPITALPAESREFFRQPLTALALRHQADGEPMLDLAKTTVDTESGSEDGPLMRVDAGSSRLLLNSAHPLFAAVRNRIGDNPKGREALRLLELVALSDVLLEGHLLDIGVDEELVDRIVGWRSGQLRSIAVRYEHQPDKVIAEVRDASYPGGARFERALSALFTMFGFLTHRDGESGKKDVLVVAPIGEDEFRFTVEAKGSKKKVANDAAEISGASAHAAAVGARFALVVAREFAGFAGTGEDEAAVLQECRTQKPPVAVVTVDALAALYEALQLNHYPLTTLVSALAEIQTPDEKLETIRALKRPTDKLDVRGLLETIWDLQTGPNSGMPTSVLQVKAARPEWKAMDRDDFERAIYAVEAMSAGLLTFSGETYSVTLQTSPSIVAEAVDSTLTARTESDTTDA